MGKIPFSMLPGSWGLKGKTRRIAQIEYELGGEERDREVAKVEFEYDKPRLTRRMLELDRKYLRISDYEYDKAVAESEPDETKRAEMLLSVGLQYNRISTNQHNKELATLHKEPWVAVNESHFDKEDGLAGFSMELDYNEFFVALLRENDFEGHTDDQIVNAWFNELCRQIANEDGIIDDLPTNIVTRKPTKRINDNGKIEYS